MRTDKVRKKEADLGIEDKVFSQKGNVYVGQRLPGTQPQRFQILTYLSPGPRDKAIPLHVWQILPKAITIIYKCAVCHSNSAVLTNCASCLFRKSVASFVTYYLCLNPPVSTLAISRLLTGL